VFPTKALNEPPRCKPPTETKRCGRLFYKLSGEYREGAPKERSLEKKGSVPRDPCNFPRKLSPPGINPRPNQIKFPGELQRNAFRKGVNERKGEFSAQKIRDLIKEP